MGKVAAFTCSADKGEPQIVIICHEEVFDMYAFRWNEDDAKRVWHEDVYEDVQEDDARSMLENGADEEFTAKCIKLLIERVQKIYDRLKK